MCGGGGLGKLVGQGINAMFLGTTDAAGLTGEGSMFDPDQGLEMSYQSETAQSTNVASDVQAARDDEKRRRAAAAGLSSTILGGSMAGTQTATKTLLGQ
ncbi:hypothetical protein [Pseudomonas sp. PSKL.D1]|uniref:hypothetical protein n=1 Tax=Pseudomonas sp. PSKL.D1 TaxID=3029060 RepID=UPI00238192EB|nr:hypothetical protein [Pseudomonas sp. PSKL.D1]WDY60385.1 hypothetical protein PVV54_12390 [Pseudomonas sp. PSKL.D1]